MKKQALVIFLLILISTMLNAQSQPSVDISWSEEYKTKGRYVMSEQLIGQSEDFYYFMAVPKKQIFIYQFDKQMNFVNMIDTEIDVHRQYVSIFNGISYVDNNIYVFYTVIKNYNKEHVTSELKYKKIDAESMTVKKEVKLISTVHEGNFRSNFYHIKQSSDNTKTLVVSQFYPKSMVLVFDESMELLWENEIESEEDGNFRIVEDYIVDNNANVYTLNIFSSDYSDIDENKELTYYYKIINYFKSGDDVYEYEIDDDDKFLTDIVLNFDENNGRLSCSGFYSENHRSYTHKRTRSPKFFEDSYVGGISYMEIDTKEDKIISEWLTPFETKTINKYTTKKEKNKLKKGDKLELQDYIIKQSIKQENGDVLIIAEQFYDDETDTQLGIPYFTQSTYTYSRSPITNNILVISVTDDGEIRWVNTIEKNQEGAVNFFNSYSFVQKNNKLYFLYNDRPGNSMLNPEKVKEYSATSFPLLSEFFIVEMDQNGKLTNKTSLYNASKTGFIPNPSTYIQLPNKDLYILCSDKVKTIKFMKVSFK